MNTEYNVHTYNIIIIYNICIYTVACAVHKVKKYVLSLRKKCHVYIFIRVATRTLLLHSRLTGHQQKYKRDLFFPISQNIHTPSTLISTENI